MLHDENHFHNVDANDHEGTENHLHTHDIDPAMTKADQSSEANSI